MPLYFPAVNKSVREVLICDSETQILRTKSWLYSMLQMGRYADTISKISPLLYTSHKDSKNAIKWK